ncbi:MAG: response regulator [Chloroflexota bacterium]|nr:response regulator [Chloroflexota bacterium]
MQTYMIVEDEPDLYEMLTHMSTMIGVNEVAFTTGEESVAWIEEVDAGLFNDDLPVLALIDIRLPGATDGIMVAERLRASPHLQHVAVVLMTAYHLSPEDEAQAKQRAGANLLLYKPLPRIADLRQILANEAQARLKTTDSNKPKKA